MTTIKRVLVSGGTGYIGSYICKMMAACHPHLEVVCMSIEPVEVQKQMDPYMAKFKNISYVQGNCLYPNDDTNLQDTVQKSDAVIHTVGTLLDGSSRFNYKDLIRDLESGQLCRRNPVELLQEVALEMQKNTTSVKTELYDQSSEGLNRDSCINMATLLADSESVKPKPFVFLSAAGTIAPMFEKYSQMKREAELHLLQEKRLQPVILRPGLVWTP